MMSIRATAGALLLALSSPALSVPAQAQAPAPGPAPATSAPASPSTQPASPDAQQASQETRQIEARTAERIKSLHDRLHITAAEEQNWQAFTAVMMDGAKQTAARLQARQQSFAGMNAVQDLQSYAEFTQDQGQQISRLVAPFQTLYAQFSPEQKQAADRIFHNYTERASARPRG